MKKAIPARIHVLMAKDSPNAVVIRRGPSRYTATIGWNRKTDKFEIGQWLNGRIYERRSDISPDGKYLIYFAMNGRWHSKVKGSWTAISKTPYLKALSLFAKGDCWHGGGLFFTPTEYWLNNGYGHETMLNSSKIKKIDKYPWHQHYGGECLGVYFIRLQRDGWEMKNSSSDFSLWTFEKRINNHWILRKYAHAGYPSKPGRGVYYDTHELINQKNNETINKEPWEWAEVDSNRIVWATNGCIYAGQEKANGLCNEKMLYDFNSMQFEEIKAPY